MAHPTETELRQLGQDIIDKAVEKIWADSDSNQRAMEDYAREQWVEAGAPGDGPPHAVPVVTDEDRREFENTIREMYSFIPDTFARFAEPNPDNCDSEIQSLVTAMTYLKPSLEGSADIDGDDKDVSEQNGWADPSVVDDLATTATDRVGIIRDTTADWRGNAATSFHSHYISKFNTSIGYQHDVVLTLAATLEAHQEIFKRAGVDIKDIGNTTLGILDEVGGWSDPDAAQATLTIAAALVGVAAAGATGGTSLFLTGVAASGSIAATVIGASGEEEDNAKPTIEGETVQEILNSMLDAVSDLTTRISTQEQRVVSALEEVTGNVDARAKQIEIPPPADFTAMEDASYEDVRDDDDGFYRT